MRPIDADEVFRIRDEQCDNCECLEPCFDCVIKRTPTLEVVPVVHGRWVFNPQKDGYLWKCSECNGNFEQTYRYCPYCGAKMDEKDGEQK